MPSSTGPVVVITEGGAHAWALVNACADRFPDMKVILEKPESKLKMIRRRVRLQGWISAAGQLGTMILIRLSKRLASARASRIIAEHKLEGAPRQGQVVVDVPSANAPECLRAVEQFRPALVLLIGCRMLTRQTLKRMSCPVVNYHAGITPKYRGMNGGYWALAAGDRDNFGTTMHMVDAGVDTGAVLAQVRGRPAPGDTIATYPLVMAAISRQTCVDAVAAVLAGRARPFDPGLPSHQWFHPTFWSYIWTGLTKRVW